MRFLASIFFPQIWQGFRAVWSWCNLECCLSLEEDWNRPLHISHSNSSATRLCVSVTWRSAWSFRLNVAGQYGQENLRSPTCAEATCFLKSVAWTNVLAQIWHECWGLDSPGTQWVVRRWYRRPLSENTFLALLPFPPPVAPTSGPGQSGQVNRGRSWAHLMCCFKFEVDLNTFGHREHPWGRASLWR